MEKIIQKADILKGEHNDTKKMFIPVACKTGTAEYGDPKNKTHAWFTVFAPLPKENSNLQPQGRALNSQLTSHLIPDTIPMKM